MNIHSRTGLSITWGKGADRAAETEEQRLLSPPCPAAAQHPPRWTFAWGHRPAPRCWAPRNPRAGTPGNGVTAVKAGAGQRSWMRSCCSTAPLIQEAGTRNGVTALVHSILNSKEGLRRRKITTASERDWTAPCQKSELETWTQVV